MKSGRSERSGSVVASSRAKRVNAEPVVLSSRSPTCPLRGGDEPRRRVELQLRDRVVAAAEREQTVASSCTNGCSRAHSRSPSISG